MIKIKTEEEIKIMTISGHILAETLFEVLKHVKPGVSETELDKLADKLIIEKGGEPGFKKVRGISSCNLYLNKRRCRSWHTFRLQIERRRRNRY
jgi:methionine aminopeptidase